MSTMRKTKGSGVMPAVMTFWNADESFNQKETSAISSGFWTAAHTASP